MINVTHYIAPRQSYKTTTAVNRFLDLPVAGSYNVFATGLDSQAKLLSYRFTNLNCLSLKRLENSNCQTPISNLFFDEFLLTVKEPSFFIMSISHRLRPWTNIYLYSTPDKIYTQEEIDTNQYLFLKTQRTQAFNIEVVHAVGNRAEEHGFKKIRPIEQRSLYYFLNDDRFKAEALGLYLDSQYYPSIFSSNYISKPKKFKIK